MVDVKEILVVDDHFEMLESLRSMLELSSRDYRVLGVPSAEEGFLELRRTPFDLMITDVRLPGMSGFELVRKVREIRPELPVIMITAYSSAQGKQEAEQLGVARYFQKPLDAEALLASVHAALYQETALFSGETARPLFATEKAESGGVTQDELARRLQSLVADTGAVEALLVSAAGEVVRRVGHQSRPEMSRAAQITARLLQDSFELADLLQSEEPFTIQYQAGNVVDVYSANVGREYFLMLLFDAQKRRARIGTVWIFAQRAVKDLKEMVPDPHTGSHEPSPEPPATESATPAEDSVSQDKTSQVPPFEWPAGELSPDGGMADEGAPPSPGGAEDDGQWPAGNDEETLLGFLEDAAEIENVDLDAYWEDAAGLAESDAGMRGLSYDEAVQRGLLSPDMPDVDEGGEEEGD